ncbi:MAG: hypothetical protein ACO1QB_02170 [Verrucomicrobiales bacterium]
MTESNGQFDSGSSHHFFLHYGFYPSIKKMWGSFFCAGILILSEGHLTDLSEIIYRSKPVQDVIAINPERAVWFKDGAGPGFEDIFVGFDMGTHFTRATTLRIWRDGKMAEYGYDESGEEILLPLNY